MVNYTDRLKIKLVEETDSMDPELWNEPFQRIDSLCLARTVVGNVIYPKNEKSMDLGDGHPFAHYFVFLTDPSDKDEWDEASVADFRVYVNEENHLIIEPDAKIPNIDIHITIWGLY